MCVCVLCRAHYADAVVLVCRDRSARYTAEEALSHPWLRGDTAGSVALSPSMSKALRSFHGASQFKSVFLSLFAHTLSDAQVEDVRQTFFKLDKSHTGHVRALRVLRVLLVCVCC